ncbi:hypothetical protein Tco_1436302 [Tanacetum coccineum]
MEDEFYGLTVKENDLKTYIRRFQELAVLCPNMVPNSEKLMEAFIGGLPQSIKGNVTASKPQTLEEATNIAHKLMDQILKRDSVRIEDKKLLGLILPKDTMETFLCVQDAPCITQEFALSNVRFAMK